jgi:hypothetical protein
MAVHTTDSASLAIAVSGALFASITIGRDIRRWWLTGRRISIALLTDMRMLGWPQYEGQALMVLQVTNEGDKPITIGFVSLQHYESRWDCWRRRPRVSAVVAGTSPEHAVPCIVQPGKTWAAFLERDREIDAMAAQGYLYVGLTHSRAPKPILRRVVVRRSS